MTSEDTSNRQKSAFHYPEQIRAMTSANRGQTQSVPRGRSFGISGGQNCHIATPPFCTQHFSSRISYSFTRDRRLCCTLTLEQGGVFFIPSLQQVPQGTIVWISGVYICHCNSSVLYPRGYFTVNILVPGMQRRVLASSDPTRFLYVRVKAAAESCEYR